MKREHVASSWYPLWDLIVADDATGVIRQFDEGFVNGK
jgi:hypothetical protein